MAKIIKKSSHLQREYQRKQHHALRWFLLSLLGIILFVAGIAPLQPVLIVIGLAWFFVCVVVALVPVRGLNGLKAGIQGELDGAALLQDLPDTYLCLQNATVSYRGKASEMDLVVAGPTGLVIVEVKNRNGHITGNFESKDWVQHKIGRRGGEYDSSFYNPTKQVGTHIYRLAHHLRSHGCDIHIHGAVLFPNPDTSLTLTGDSGDIPVFFGKDAGKNLLRHIRSLDTAPSKETQKHLFRLLREL